MRLPPKMPQRAMVRIWVASLHQKASTYTSTLRFLFCDKVKLIERVDSNSCGDVAEDGAKTAQWAVFSSAARAIHPRPPRTPVSEPGTGVSVLSALQNGLQGWIRTATATTAASGRNREELLGLRPAGCACRPRHDAAAGSRDPGSFSARLAQSARAHQELQYPNRVLEFLFTCLTKGTLEQPVRSIPPPADIASDPDL